MARQHNFTKRPPSALSLDIEWGELENEDQHLSNSKHRAGSRAVSSRTSNSSRNSISKKDRNRESDPNIQILRDGFDDDEEWMVEEYMTDDDDNDDETDNDPNESYIFGSVASNSPSENTDLGALMAYNSKRIPFSERFTNNQIRGVSQASSSSSLRDSIDSKQPSTYGSLQQGIDVDGVLVTQNEHVDTDEENEIVKRIRDEITAQIKVEIAGSSDFKSERVDENEDTDPKLQEALLQMRKYDRILEKRSQRERQVKKERILLQKRLRQELDDINNNRKDGFKSSKEETVNTERFLSLPPSLARFDKGIIENSDDDESVDPVFATQPPEYTSKSKTTGSSKISSKHSSYAESQSTAGNSSFSAGNTSDTSRRSRKSRKKHQQNGAFEKDFIQRNIDLAADAGNAIAMTDDEKKRLADILEGVDELEEDTPDNNTDSLKVAIIPGQGFYMDTEDQQRMSHIDSKLERLLGQEEFNATFNTPPPVSLESLQLFTRVHEPGDEAITLIGERALQETKEFREQQKRLADIEKALSELSTAVQAEIDSPQLTDQQLNILLEQCRKMMSRATAVTESIAQSPRGQSTARSDTLSPETPPLESSVLNSLLEQARAEGIKSKERQTSTPQTDSSFLDMLTEAQRAKLLNSLNVDSMSPEIDR